MKIKVIYIIVSLIIGVLIQGCEKEDAETGINGFIEYGESDCLPSDGLDIDFEAYGGELFFIKKEELDSLQIESFNDILQLRNNSISVQINQGELFTELPVGDFYVWAENIYESSERYIISVKFEEILHKDIKFVRCLH